MKQFVYLLIGTVLMTTPTIIVPENVEAQLGKIHRKYAQVDVSPQVVTQGYSFFVTVQPWIGLEEWQLQILDGGSIIAEKIFTAQLPVIQHEFTLDGTEGEKTIRLLGKENGRWTILQEKSVEFVPGFYNEVQAVYDELRAIEATQDSHVLPAWIHNTMANVEDLMERIKSADSGQGRDLQNRLNQIKEMAAALKAKKDPYAGKTGYLLRGYRSPYTGEIQLYSSYLPNGFDPAKKYPTVIMLHGAWSNHHLAMRRVMGKTNRRGEDDAAAKRSMPQLPDVPFIVLAPNGYETMGYMGVAQKDVLAVKYYFDSSFISVDDKIHSPIDENRVYLTGLSMGGGGTGRIGINHADYFAAIAPVCGYFDARFRGNAEGLPDFVKKLLDLKSPKNMAENLLHVPVKLMHGDADPVVPPEGSRELHDILRKMEYHSELEMYPGVDHDAWTPAYENARIFDWFSQFERNPYPKHVKYKTAELQGNAYWTHILMAKKARQFAAVDASIEDGTMIIKTDNVEKLIISLHNQLTPLNQELKIMLDEQQEFVITPKEYVKDNNEHAKILFSHNGAEWSMKQWDVMTDDNAGYPYPALSGFFASTEHRHSYVYGTKGSEAETQRLQAIAEDMAFWGDMTDVKWDVLPEDEVDYTTPKVGNVFLISKINSSSYVQDHIQSLPIQIKGERIHFGERIVEKDQGFIFVYPIKDTPWYITVCTAATNEGLNGIEAFARRDFSFLGSTYGDFVCLDKDGNPLWGGLFDKNWKIETVEDY